MPSISISQVYYVITLHRTGSFSEAAETCHVTQSTLSTMIKKLEDQLEFQIFDRKTKPIKLTPEGKEIIDQFNVLYHEYDNLIEQAQKTKDVLYGTMKIGIIPTLAPFILPLVLTNLTTSHPNVQFTVMEITTEEIIKRISIRELDVGLISTPVKDDLLIQRPLFMEDLLIYDARKGQKKQMQYTVEDIDLSRLWLLEESHCLSNQIEKICVLKKSQSSEGNLIYRSGSFLSLIKLVESHQGITLIPRIATIQDNILNPKFIHRIKAPSPGREIGTITHPNFTKSRLLQSFEEKITESVNPVLKKLKKLDVINPF